MSNIAHSRITHQGVRGVEEQEGTRGNERSERDERENEMEGNPDRGGRSEERGRQ